MQITCENCGHVNTVKGLGRKRKSIPLINVYELLSKYKNVKAAADELETSVAWIYKTVGKDKIRELIN